MSDLYYVGSGPVNLPAGSALCTLALHTASKPRIDLNKISVSFNGTSSTAIPVYAVIAAITNTPSGTSIPTGYGPNPLDPAGPTAATTAATASAANPGTWTTAPVQGSVLWDMYIPPTSGYPEWYPLGQAVKVPVSTWVGVFLNAPATVTAATSLIFTE
jgi:hypothetical protein